MSLPVANAGVSAHHEQRRHGRHAGEGRDALRDWARAARERGAAAHLRAGEHRVECSDEVCSSAKEASSQA